MAYPSRLEADGLTTLQLSAAAGYIVTGFDLGDAATREVAENAPDADGTIDTTTFIGSRAVTMSLALSPDVDSIETMWNRLRAFTSPRVRPKLFFRFDDAGTEMMLTLRRSQWNGLLTHSRSARVTLQWIAPSGLIEAATLSSVTAGAGGEVAQNGLTFDATPDFSFGGVSQASGGALCNNVGNMPVWPVVTMYGPASAGIVLRNDTTDKEMTFLSTLSIASGDWLKIDFAAKTIVNSTGTSYYDTLNFASSEWWQLATGENRIYMLPTTFTAPPASFLVEWRSAYL